MEANRFLAIQSYSKSVNPTLHYLTTIICGPLENLNDPLK